jgi:hypothetical protein
VRTRAIRLFMLFEAATFVAASLVHAGVLITGYEHREARIAERVIAIALLAGVFTIAIGIGPRTAPDIAYHVGIVLVLACGLVVAARARLDEARQRP